MHHRTAPTLALLCHAALLLAPCSSAQDGPKPEVPSKSPNGKFVVRLLTEAERAKVGEDDAPTVGLYDVKAGRRIACPVLDGLEAFPESLSVVWAKDSTRVAFNHRAGGRYYTTQLCELKDGKSVDLPSPEEPVLEFLRREKANQVKQLGLKPDAYQRRIHDEVELRRWIDATTIEVDGHSISTVQVKKKPDDEDEEGETVDLDAKARFTLQLDPKKKAWKILKSQPLKEE
jgi:hypothetical protein